jgi:hypothetical protein
MLTEATFAFIDGVRDREIKQNLIMGNGRPLKEALTQALRVEAASALVEPSLKASRKRLYTARTLVQARERVPVRNVNVTDGDQVLSGGTVVGHCEPVTWIAPVGDQEHHPQATQRPYKQLQDVISDPKPNLDLTETRTLEKFITDFQDAFATRAYG